MVVSNSVLLPVDDEKILDTSVLPVLSSLFVSLLFSRWTGRNMILLCTEKNGADSSGNNNLFCIMKFIFSKATIVQCVLAIIPMFFLTYPIFLCFFLRSPIKSKGHITLDVCTPEGQVARSVFSRSNLQHVPALFTALRKTTWGGLFPVISSNLERSDLSKNAKGTRYLGNSERDKGSQVLFDKFSNTKSAKAKAAKDSNVVDNSRNSKGGKSKSVAMLDADDSDSESYAAQAAQSIPGLKPGMVPSGEMIAASKSARYRRLLEVQAMREEEEEERAQENVEKESTGRSRGRGRGVSAQLERLKAKRAQKEAESADA